MTRDIRHDGTVTERAPRTSEGSLTAPKSPRTVVRGNPRPTNRPSTQMAQEQKVALFVTTAPPQVLPSVTLRPRQPTSTMEQTMQRPNEPRTERPRKVSGGYQHGHLNSNPLIKSSPRPQPAVLEVFNALGESICVTAISVEDIEPLRPTKSWPSERWPRPANARGGGA